MAREIQAAQAVGVVGNEHQRTERAGEDVVAKCVHAHETDDASGL
jgi:hypothetical protein